jgi:hypothetical protein
MTSLALRPVPRGASRGRVHRHPRRSVASDVALISVAGLVGSRVYDDGWALAGRLGDLVIHWTESEAHPPLEGIVVHTILHGRAFVPTAAIAELRPDELVLACALERRPFERKPWLVALAHDVLDRQIVDVDGGDVARISDLVLGRTYDGVRLVGVDVSARTLLRRLGPARIRRRVARDRVYDWGSVAAFSARGAEAAGSVLHLSEAAARLRERGPTDITALLGDLPPNERAQLERVVAGERTS